MSLSANDERWLDSAVRIATPFLGTTAENPTVAALVVAPDGRLVGRAVTAKGGRPHAETQALTMAGRDARGATLYVTLEPCNHWGRTPPCADAVLRSGVTRVVIGQLDPDPRTSGQSIERFRRAGLDVVVANHKPSYRLHEAHFTRKAGKRSFVTVKLAVSADGRIGKPGIGNFAISGDTARRWTHMERAKADAVMVGANTAIVDNPKLTVRLPGLEQRTPMRVILAGASPLPKTLSLVYDLPIYPVLVLSTPDNELKLPPSVEQLKVEGTNKRPHLPAALKALADRGIAHLFVEGGARLSEGLLALKLVDRFEWIESPLSVGEDGVLASAARGGLAERLAGSGLVETGKMPLGEDTLRTFERAA